MASTVIGWVSAYDKNHKTAPFTAERKKALIERIRKREYNFNHFDHEMMVYCAPYYDDNKYCILTKKEFDGMMNEVYKDEPRGERILPMDVIELEPENGILFEKQKFKEQYGGDSHG